MVTPLGNDPESSWQTLVAGESGAGPITHFDTADYDVHFACELKEFDPTVWIDRKQARRMDRFSQLALSAARMAEADSGVSIASQPERVGAAVATGIGGLYVFENCFQTLLERGPDRTSPFAIVQIIPNMAAAGVSMELGAQGPLAAECTACAASNMAIGDGLDAIGLGRADVMFCGGTEAPITRVGIAGFTAMRALSRRERRPETRVTAVRLWPRRVRYGRGCGEGSSRARGARARTRPRRQDLRGGPWGYGVSSDASHVSDPDPTGATRACAMRMAFSDAWIEPEVVGDAAAHGTSTPSGDSAETRVLKLALGEEKAYRTPVSSTKGATGHCLGAAGAVEAIFTTFALKGTASCRRRSTTRTPIPSATSTTSRTRRGARRSRSRSRTRLASADTTPASSSAAGPRPSN